MQELIDIIEEEAEILGPEDRTEEIIKDNLYSAATKINMGGPATILTLAERAAVRYALEDVGELYLFTGTSEGFKADVVGEENVQEHISRGRKAREQAAALGIYL